MRPAITRPQWEALCSALAYFLLWPAFFLFLSAAAADNDSEEGMCEYGFERFELPGGNLGNSVQCIVQDSLGFLWFASQAGLHRYDGYRIKTYLHDPENVNTISSNYVEWLLIDCKGQLWAGTWGNGLNRFDYAAETFERYLPDPAEEHALSNGFISMMVEDPDGSIWVATMDGLHRLDPQTGRFRRYRHDPADSISLVNNQVRSLYLDSENVLWVGTGFPFDGEHSGGLSRYHRKADIFTNFQYDPQDPNSLRQDEVRALLEDSKGNFWVGTAGDGLHQLNRSNYTFKHYPYDPAQSGRLSQPHVPNSDQPSGVTFVFEDQQKKLWIGAYYGGLLHYDPKTGKARHYHFEPAAFHGLNTNYLWHMFQSRDGTLWVTGGGGGQQVYRVLPQRTDFEFFSLDRYLISSGAVQAVMEDRQGNVWMGTEASGLLQYYPDTDEFRTFRHDPGNPNSISSDNVNVIFEDSHGFIWIGFWDSGGGLNRLEPKTGRVKRYKNDPADPQSLSHDNVIDIAEDQNGNIWIATTGGGLNKYDPRQDVFVRYEGGENKVLPHGYLSQLFVDRSGKLWIAGGGGIANPDYPLFLVQFDPQTETFDFFHFSYYNYYKKSSFPWISSMHEDENGYLWLTTYHSLVRLDREKRSSKQYLADETNLYRSEIKGAIRDEKGNFWIMGNKRLTIFDPKRERSINVDYLEEPNRMRNFFWHAAWRMESGLLLFGSLGGVYGVLPDQLLESMNDSPPQALLTEFRVFDQPLVSGADKRLAAPIWEAKEVLLPYYENVFSIDFAAIHFLHPEANRLEYQLENYDDTWREAGPDPSATYIKVPPGEYRFRVRAANSFGVWSEEEASIGVVVAPPWWNTWWAYLLSAITGLLLAFGIYRALLNRQLMKAEAVRLREVNEVRTKLYTNITHEFRTPLTIISGMVDHIEADPERWLAKGVPMIRRNSHQLLHLVNQLLDLRKVEAGSLPLNYKQGDVVAYIEYITESFHSYAECKGVNLHFLAREDKLLMDHDPDKLLNILSNLLSNALKFTPPGGQVYVDLDRVRTPEHLKVPTEEGLVFRLQVRDTGAGIPQDKLPHIFDLFYQVDDSTTRRADGAGVGLALTREFVKLMRGDIAVKSNEKGTAFTIWLPVTKRAPFSTEEPTSPEVTFAAPAAGAAMTNEEPVSPMAVQDQDQPLVLIVEDNPDVVRYLSASLDQNYRLAVAPDGQAGIEKATDLIPDLIISDIMMPEKDGYQLCDTLKRDDRTSHIPIILLTAKADQDSKIAGLKTGADAYLSKPFDKEELTVRLEQLLALRKKLQQHYLRLAGLSNRAVAAEEVPDVSASEDAFVQQAREVVLRRLDDFNFDVREFCSAMNLSRSQLHRKLTAVTGCSPNKFIRYIRLQRARELLETTQEPIGNIAFDTGFQDPDYFGRVFRQEVGVTPTEYRGKGIGSNF